MNVTISGEYIELNKLLKHLGRVDSGGEAKLAVTGGLVHVNGEEELRIRRKCISGDVVEFEGEGGDKVVEPVFQYAYFLTLGNHIKYYFIYQDYSIAPGAKRSS